MVMADPAKKKIYEDAAKAKGKPLFSLTVADFFNVPSVDEVDLSGYAGAVGDVIGVRASDDFDVTGVHVAVTKADGTAIEEGEAVEMPPDSGHPACGRQVGVYGDGSGADRHHRTDCSNCQ